jgi:hypothetical protein
MCPLKTHKQIGIAFVQMSAALLKISVTAAEIVGYAMFANARMIRLPDQIRSLTFTLGLGPAGLTVKSPNLLSPPKTECFTGSELREKVGDNSSDLKIFAARRVCHHILNF